MNTNRLASLYLELKLIAASREITMMVNGKPTEYNLYLGREVIDKIIKEEENETTTNQAGSHKIKVAAQID